LFYVLAGLVLAGQTLVGLPLGLRPEHHGMRLQEVIVSVVPVLFLLKRPRTGTVPILLMSAALIILVNRWLFGYGPIPGMIGLVFAILTAVAGFRLRNQIDITPKRSAWVWIAAVALLFGILWLYSFDTVQAPVGRLLSDNFDLLQEPGNEILKCAERTESSMEVTAPERQVRVRAIAIRPRRASGTNGPGLPVAVSPSLLRRGHWITKRHADGWFVGLDAGEFGGGLWWVTAAGSDQQIIESNYPVLAIGDTSHGMYVVTADEFDFDATEETSAFTTIEQDKSQHWHVTSRHRVQGEFIADLEDRADGIYILGPHTLSLWTGSEWLSVPAEFHPLEARLGPFSMVADNEAIYVGMRLLVLKIPKAGGAGSWFAPRDCRTFDLGPDGCRCSNR
jgi:hypothetical protein